ncbi:YggT family protein [Spirochaeta thermophila]|uniref:YggT family protein n=1 Tax=Winmispira thermophila (strain ATCC 49972 / DSM 6192 / RI 19.B1) TaxID=665571 RepID=E0RRX0_WINT6|nr:YggT family protein [Spirochaeta thermophila]ADN01757.1 hypothetical protein STHERM_c08080 [Spirochaeta thermophila DSM 6192]
MIATILYTLSALVTLYSLILIIRILLSWFYPSGGEALFLLYRITDPYLALFRRIGFLRTERFDFSPIIALLALSVLGNIFLSLARTGRIYVGQILSIIVGGLWFAVSFILMFFVILIAVRLLGIAFRANSVGPFWFTLDNILSPLTYSVSHFFWRTSRPLSYRTGLLITGVLFLLLNLAGNALVSLVTRALILLPF